MKALVWSVATYGWTLRKNEETRLDAFESEKDSVDSKENK